MMMIPITKETQMIQRNTHNELSEVAKYLIDKIVTLSTQAVNTKNWDNI